MVRGRQLYKKKFVSIDFFFWEIRNHIINLIYKLLKDSGVKKLPKMAFLGSQIQLYYKRQKLKKKMPCGRD